ncbi:hypothetical protein [Aneurinibacillus terranovensis]|uniref:hypothetical protein n=1 Tax=Aneurinibacillus terranovensis TaxID=278991 RepID=UPI0003FE684A|nr:hypothetical protein [Aneurinibacillus terranovensis]
MRKKYTVTALFGMVLALGTLVAGCSPLNHKVSAAEQVSMRKFPYPYRAMLSLTSDIDGTTPEEFAQYHRFLNTLEPTPVGKGLGLDVGDSFWMYNGTKYSHPYFVDDKKDTNKAVMTYFQGMDTAQKKDAAKIKYYWNAGWIDSMHGYGDFSQPDHRLAYCTRQYAEAAWQHLKADGIMPEIWINHGNEANKQNFGDYKPYGFSSYQEGDNPKSPYYHTDILLKNGVRFVWNSTSDSAFGENNALFPIHLRDGRSVWGFHRYAFDKGKKNRANWTWGPGALYIQLTKNRLDELVAKRQYAIVAQHFGGGNRAFPFYGKNVAALRLLARYNDDGKILVARTSRLLRYNLAQNCLKYHTKQAGDEKHIILDTIDDPIFGKSPVTIDEIRGITFYVGNSQKAKIFIGNQPVPENQIQRNPADETGKQSIGIKWFAPNVYDYSRTAP